MSTKRTQTKVLNAANKATYDALTRLSESLKELDDTGRQAITTNNSKKSSSDETNSVSSYTLLVPLRHWRELSDEVLDAYKMIKDGAEYVKATSTKYTLMGKASPDGDFGGLAQDLLKGAEIVAAGALVIHTDSAGCGRSCRYYVKRAVRGMLACLMALV